ncbi:MAG: DNA polymerase I [Lachnospiraceae bacterium]|nr:DNA polymerase I [Lachnospiraceae bacterium]
MSRIVLMDGHDILRKAYYNVPVMSDSAGFQTNAIYGFLNVLLKVAETEKPEYLSVVFGTETFGQNCQEADKVPVGLREQTNVLKELLAAMKINVIAKEISAASLIGSIAKHFEMEQMEVTLVSGNRNFLQLASEQIKICIPETGSGQTALRNYNAVDVEEINGVTPAQFLELRVLAEAAGIGEKTAGDLIKTYGSIENLYLHSGELSQKSIREKIIQKQAAVNAKKNNDLFNTTEDISIPVETMECGTGSLFTPEASAILRKLALKDKFEQGESERPTTKIDINKDVKIVAVKTVEDIRSAFDRAVKAGSAAVRLIHVKAKNAGEFGAHADGQMYLQMDADEEAFGCLLCGGSEDGKNVYFIESGTGITQAQIKEQLEKMLLSEKMSVSVFDVKNDYGNMISEENDRNLSSSELTNHLFDCKIAAYLVNPLKNDYEITDVADEYLNIQLQKWSELFGKTDFNTAYRSMKAECLSYLAKETYVLHQAKPILEEALRQNNMAKLFRELEMPLTYVLFDMEREGILVKPEELKAYGEALNGRIEELEKAIHTEAGEGFNINSPKQLGEILFDKMKLPGGKKTKTGYSTAADVLEKLAPEYPVVKDILEYRGLTKLKSTYADGLAAYIEDDDKIHTNFNQTITATGRLSSTEPNLQNIPMRMELGRRIRKVFIPQEGCVFMDADYSQIELRVLAHMSGDKQLIEAYKMDEDIHRITASKVFHTPFEEVTDLQRRNAKAVNFGIVYGISSFGLSQDLSITPREAKTYIDEYFRTYPGIKRFLDKMVDDARETGYCETMFGRRRPVPELKSSNFNQRSFGERVAMNSPIQGTAADIIKYAMVHVYDALKAKGLKSKLILQIHDELLIETRSDEVEEVRTVLSQEMQNACELAVKLEIDLHTGTDWYEAK